MDDEPPAREGIRLLAARDPQIEIVAEAASGHEAVTLIRQLRPDLVFLDVQMPELDGFDVLAAVGAEAMPAAVFVTAYDRYALQAFEVNALDYLLKPFSDERFFKTLQRAKTQIAQGKTREFGQRLSSLLHHQRQQSETPETPRQRFIIKSGGRVCFLDAEEIDWVEAADYYVVLHAGAKSHLLRETIANLETQLDARKFLRIHRSTIVNLAKVKDWRQHGNGECLLTLQNGAQLKLSRRRRKALEALMTDLS